MMPTTGASASDIGDKLDTQAVAPAWPQSVPVLGRQGGAAPLPGLGEGDLLIRRGLQVAGETAAEEV
ncbi:MAG: hypothetical protein ACREEB_13170 [Caulobacteraceae bacterium]